MSYTRKKNDMWKVEHSSTVKKKTIWYFIFYFNNPKVSRVPTSRQLAVLA